MAMHLNENLDDNGEMHDINVTPFIDVMLVLLIIFMVAAPLATVDVKVNLPASTSTPQPRPEKPVYLSVKADNSMFIGNDPVTDETMKGGMGTAEGVGRRGKRERGNEGRGKKERKTRTGKGEEE